MPALSFGFFLAKLFESVQVPFALGTGRATVLRFVPRSVDICRAHHLDCEPMNVHGPKFHRSQHTNCRLVFHKPVSKKNTFTLISIATLMLAIFALRTSAAASPKLVAAPGSLTFGERGRRRQ